MDTVSSFLLGLALGPGGLLLLCFVFFKRGNSVSFPKDETPKE